MILLAEGAHTLADFPTLGVLLSFITLLLGVIALLVNKFLTVWRDLLEELKKQQIDQGDRLVKVEGHVSVLLRGNETIERRLGRLEDFERDMLKGTKK